MLGIWFRQSFYIAFFLHILNMFLTVCMPLIFFWELSKVIESNGNNEATNIDIDANTSSRVTFSTISNDASNDELNDALDTSSMDIIGHSKFSSNVANSVTSMAEVAMTSLQNAGEQLTQMIGELNSLTFIIVAVMLLALVGSNQVISEI